MEFEQLLQLIQAVSDSELTGFKYEADGVILNLKKEKEHIVTAATGQMMDVNPSAVLMQNAGILQSTETRETLSENNDQQKTGQLIKSPLVGTFYAAPAEDAVPFVTVGDTVTKGQTVAIVEAMKLMNDIESDFTGTVAEVLVENGEMVEYGQPLFRIV